MQIMPHYRFLNSVTYMVGGLNIINATAGAYSDDLPFLVISGNGNHPVNETWMIVLFPISRWTKQ